MYKDPVSFNYFASKNLHFLKSLIVNRGEQKYILIEMVARTTWKSEGA